MSLHPDIVAHVKEAIGATVLHHEISPRLGWDGEECDTRVDFAVLWYREQLPGRNEARSFGTHTGVIRRKKEEKHDSVHIFWGHYDLEESEARQSYSEKRSRL